MDPFPINFLYCGTPSAQLQGRYSNFQQLFSGREIYTQLPRVSAIIRVIATLTFTALAALKLSSTRWCGPIAITGLAFASWTIYSHFLRKDPLVETFYKIVGGKDQFDDLPEVDLQQSPNERISEAIERIEWDQLEKVNKTTTLDGRCVVVIKGLTNNFYTNNSNTNNFDDKSVLVFIEKLGPEDKPKSMHDAPLLVDTIFQSICAALSFGENKCDFLLNSREVHLGNNRRWELHSSISPDMANEILAQL